MSLSRKGIIVTLFSGLLFGCQPSEPVSNNQSSIAQQPSVLSSESSNWQLAYDEFTLANGIRVILIQNSYAPVVSAGSYFYAGYRQEPEQFSAYAKFFPQVLNQQLKNTYQQSEKSIVQGLGGQIRSSVRGDLVSHTISLPSSQLNAALTILAKRQQPISLTKSQLQDLKSKYISNLESNYFKQAYAGFPWFHLPNQVFSQWPDSHNYYANLASVYEVTLQSLAAYQQASQHTSKQTLVVNGDIDLVTTKSQIEKLFTSFPQNNITESSWPNEEITGGNRYQLYDAKISAPAMTIGFVMPSLKSKDFWPAMLLQHYLVTHFSDYRQSLNAEINTLDIQLTSPSELLVDRLLGADRQILPISFIYSESLQPELLEKAAYKNLMKHFMSLNEAKLGQQKLALKQSIFSMMDTTYGSFTNQLIARFVLIDGNSELINSFDKAISEITYEQLMLVKQTYFPESQRHVLMLNKEKVSE